MSGRVFRLAGVLFAVWASMSGPAAAQDAPTKPVAPKAIKLGETLSGQLNAMRARKKGKKAAPTFQIASEPRRLPAPDDLCNLETGPETFQLAVTDAEAAQLKPLIGKHVTLKVDGIACATEAGVVSEAVVTKWKLVK